MGRVKSSTDNGNTGEDISDTDRAYPLAALASGDPRAVNIKTALAFVEHFKIVAKVGKFCDCLHGPPANWRRGF
jgi:hypothetical protein